ncbi:MAG: isoprenyl transferase [Prevotellaceae bacterium]|jgi:undecaprenyl diphosphate synthase|nr:isoprenyl transferase [Prevotellaceae bacterium]
MPHTDLSVSKHIPAHVAIIMDGNGRWAKEHGKPRTEGHKEGVEALRVIVEEAARMGVKYLTLYTFSTENWKRPHEEVSALMELLLNSIEEDLLQKNNLKLQIIGEKAKLPTAVQQALQHLMDTTNANTGMCIVLALSYSSRWELTEAVRQIAQQVQEGILSVDDISSATVAAHLSTNFMPDPDLLIRTGAEKRLSNYLLWQCAYTELYFCDTYWPDFRKDEFHRAIEDYQRRERRFGKTSEQVND